MHEDDWDRLLQQLKRGDCTPFLGAGASHPTLPTGSTLSKKVADRYHYPFAQGRKNLSRVTQYVATIHDHRTIKEHVVEIIAEARHPDFDDATEPHALLAEFPLPFYLTTNYDDFMFRALQEKGRHPPEPGMYRWWEKVRPDERLKTRDDYKPCAEEPIVYHLHGRSVNADSLVLTESDYLDFLVNLTAQDGEDGPPVVPTSIFNSLMKPLLFIGYSFQDWTFLVLYHGLLRTVAGSHQRRQVSVQLRPKLNSDPDTHGRAERYLDNYFSGWKVSVYWGTAQQFCADLREKL